MASDSGAARGEGEKASPLWVDVQKLCNMCAFIVMELLRITGQVHCKAVEQRATLIHRQYNRDWGSSYSRPPIDPYLTSPPCYKILATPLASDARKAPLETWSHDAMGAFWAACNKEIICRARQDEFEEFVSDRMYCNAPTVCVHSGVGWVIGSIGYVLREDGQNGLQYGVGFRRGLF